MNKNSKKKNKKIKNKKEKSRRRRRNRAKERKNIKKNNNNNNKLVMIKDKYLLIKNKYQIDDKFCHISSSLINIDTIRYEYVKNKVVTAKNNDQLQLPILNVNKGQRVLILDDNFEEYWIAQTDNGHIGYIHVDDLYEQSTVV